LKHFKRALIFANGGSESEKYFRYQPHNSDIIIAADGGLQHLKSLGMLPNVVVGDLDSIAPDQIEELDEKKVLILSYPTRKDETDLELALRYANQSGIKDVLIFFALGARWDMTIANLLLPFSPEFQDMNIRIIDGPNEITILRSQSTLHISGYPGDTVSLIPIGGRAEGISSSGLEYQLVDDSLDLGSPRGVSNVLSEDHAMIHLTTGLLLCLHIKQIPNTV
jgi:thiamine pyrophosphokinase